MKKLDLFNKLYFNSKGHWYFDAPCGDGLIPRKRGAAFYVTVKIYYPIPFEYQIFLFEDNTDEEIEYELNLFKDLTDNYRYDIL